MKNVIYKIRNITNNKFYVGSTNDSRERFRNHRKMLRGNRHHCKHLQASWNKYGEDFFKFEILEELEHSELLFAAEDIWLKEWVGKKECYNSGRSAAAPMRGIAKEDHPSFGKVLSDSEKETISVGLKKYYLTNTHHRTGVKLSRETIEKIALNRTPPKGEAHYRYGKTVSDETKKKIGDAQRGVKKAPRVYTESGLKKAQENMKRNAVRTEIKDIGYILNSFPQEVLNRYDFTNAVYTGSAHRMTGCVCPQHGEFTQYSGYFRKGRGCPSCGAEERSVSKSIQMKEYWNTPEGRDTILKSRDKKETDPTKMSEKDQVEFYKTARKNLINDMETLIKPFGWKMEGVSVRTPQYIDSGIECFLKPIKKNKPIDCYDLIKKIELFVGQPNFPFPHLDGESPTNRGFWLQIDNTD